MGPPLTSRSRRRRWVTVGVVVLACVTGVLAYLVLSGRLFLHSLPDPLYYHVLANLYDKTITAKSAEEKAAAYETLIDRVGIEKLMEFHRQNFNPPGTAIALGRSGSDEALALLRGQVAACQWEPLERKDGRPPLPTQPTRWAIFGLVASKDVTVNELRAIYEPLGPKDKWCVVLAVIKLDAFRFREIVADYADHVVPAPGAENGYEHIRDMIRAFWTAESEERNDTAAPH